MSKKNCTTCANAIFDALWGEYKCKLYQHRIYNSEAIISCVDYKKSTPTESKKNKESDE